ncbi:hypothetical protein L596_000988 [Steinernema carpocapsae]|uniref:Uncharacterized protein n=1 Tax=Steinernema carpocapsae TaxID=34508 RepID=A0A4U8UM32_STECR|nr:hypothetical protein L596_000988 [Steinernema carpocapsae]
MDEFQVPEHSRRLRKPSVRDSAAADRRNTRNPPPEFAPSREWRREAGGRARGRLQTLQTHIASSSASRSPKAIFEAGDFQPLSRPKMTSAKWDAFRSFRRATQEQTADDPGPGWWSSNFVKVSLVFRSYLSSKCAVLNTETLRKSLLGITNCERLISPHFCGFSNFRA